MIKKVKHIGYENMKIGSYDGPPYSFSVKVNGKLKRMSGFDEEHIPINWGPEKSNNDQKGKRCPERKILWITKLIIWYRWQK